MCPFNKVTSSVLGANRKPCRSNDFTGIEFLVHVVHRSAEPICADMMA